MVLLKSCTLYIILTVSLINVSSITKCGEFVCHDNTECAFDQVNNKLYCICDVKFKRSQYDPNVFCCLEVGGACGHNRQCNERFECELKSKAETMETLGGTAHEECIDGKDCVLKDFTEFSSQNCDNFRQCGNKCCTGNEVCSVAKECVLKKTNDHIDAVLDLYDFGEIKDGPVETTECPDSQKCRDHCCIASEVCSEQGQCVVDATVTLKSNSTFYDSIIDLFDFNVISSVKKKNNFGDSITDPYYYNTTAVPDEKFNIDDSVIELYNLKPNAEQENKSNFNSSIFDLYDFNIITKTDIENNFDNSIINLYDFNIINEVEKTFSFSDPILDLYNFNDNDNKSIQSKCPSDHQQCQDNCCNLQQFCNDKHKCVAILDNSLCSSENPNDCAEIMQDQTENSFLGYTVIGIGCLVAIASVSLFKVYGCISLNKNTL